MQRSILITQGLIGVYALGPSDWVGKLLDLPNQLFRVIGIPDYLIPELAGPLVILLLTLGLSLFFSPIRYFLKRILRWILRRTTNSLGLKVTEETPNVSDINERTYLKWLKAELSSISQQWHETPIIPTPAHTKKPLGHFRKYKARLFRHNPNDYMQNPALNDAELSIRAGFGRRTKIKNLAGELRHHKKIVVLGDPGSGKSVCLRQLAFDLAERELSNDTRVRTLPIYVDMGAFDTWEDQQQRNPTNVFKFVKKSLLSHQSISDVLELHPLLYITNNLEKLLIEGRVTLMFDALDEMPQDSYQERYQALKEFVVMWESFEDNRFIFSCRLLDYDPSFNVDEIVIDGFDRKRIRSFLNKHAPQIANELYRRILDDETLEELVSNPFLLQALAYINMPYSNADAAALWIPATRVELLKAFIDQLLEREAGVKQKKHLASVSGGLETLRSFLAKLAFALQERKDGRTSAHTASLEGIWRAQPDWKKLLWIARRARILGKRGEKFDLLVDADPPVVEPPERIEFVHHRLQEVLAAEELANRLEGGEPVERYLEDIWWQETVIFAVGLVSEPHSVIKRILMPTVEAGTWFDDIVRQSEGSVREDGGTGGEELDPAPKEKNANKV